MRIDPKTPVTPTTFDKDSPQPAQKPAPAPTPASVVQLSPAAASSVDPASPNLTSRIQRIRELVDAGAYPVDLDKLASMIVDDELARGS
ncbi:MAG TPA: hypothetical protein VLX92_14770 [Kofleriaceae bacterium]|nr:hypothetical protein [Kofleriaceae bacterium]